MIFTETRGDFTIRKIKKFFGLSAHCYDGSLYIADVCRGYRMGKCLKNVLVCALRVLDLVEGSSEAEHDVRKAAGMLCFAKLHCLYLA